MSFVGIKPGTPDSGRAVPQNEGAKERLERLEREWAEEKRKAKEKRDAGPKLRWTPPAVDPNFDSRFKRLFKFHVYVR